MGVGVSCRIHENQPENQPTPFVASSLQGPHQAKQKKTQLAFVEVGGENILRFRGENMPNEVQPLFRKKWGKRNVSPQYIESLQEALPARPPLVGWKRGSRVSVIVQKVDRTILDGL